MTTNDLLILAALTRGPAHGYALMQATGMQAGSVYRTLKRLRAAGLVGGADPESRRLPVLITVRGQRACTEMLNRIADALNGCPDSLRTEAA